MNIATILPGFSVRARNLTVMLFIAALAADTRRIKKVRVEPLAARPHDYEHADKTDDDRAPAPQSDVLVKDQDRRNRGKKGAVKLTAVAVANGTTVIP